MAVLLDKNDRFVINNSNFVKNAVFYKDMLAFYDAYEKLLNIEKEKLPSFCFHRGRFYLEGVCLFFCTYASELGFESIRLTMDYLKVLYYTIAGISNDENWPERELIEREMNLYKSASEEQIKTSYKVVDQNYSDLSNLNQKHKKFKAKQLKQVANEKLFLILFVAIITLGVFCLAIPISLFLMSKLTLPVLILGIFCDVVATVLLALIFGFSKRHCNSVIQGSNYEIQLMTRKLEEQKEKFLRSLYERNSIVCERYEYNHNFFEKLNGDRKILSFEQILKKACEYRLLSYNISVDCTEMFENQLKEVDEVCSEIRAIKNQNFEDIKSIYKKIKSKDWLYYNNQIRFEFARQVSILSNKTHDFLMNIDGKDKFPFGLNIKNIAKQQVAFLKSKSSLFVSASFDLIKNTKLVKGLKDDIIKNLDGIQKIKAIKQWHLQHYYDFEALKSYNNIFYEKHIGKPGTISDEMLENYAEIPLIVSIDLKLQEVKEGFSNSDSPTVKKLSQSLISLIEPAIKSKSKTNLELIFGQRYESIAKKIEDGNDGSVNFSTSSGDFTGFNI